MFLVYLAKDCWSKHSLSDEIKASVNRFGWFVRRVATVTAASIKITKTPVQLKLTTSVCSQLWSQVLKNRSILLEYRTQAKLTTNEWPYSKPGTIRLNSVTRMRNSTSTVQTHYSQYKSIE